jgi:hypothetical protein
MILQSTDIIEVVTSAAVTVDVTGHYVDMTTADPPVVKGTTSGSQVAAITTATTTTVVSAPAASSIRNLQKLFVRNKHASSSVDVTVQMDRSTVNYELHKTTLRAGEMLEYIEGLGFFVVAATATPQLRTTKLASNQDSTSATMAEVTGMSLTTGTGTFAFQYYILASTSVTTSGFSFAVNHTGTVTAFVWNQMWVTSTTTASDDIIDQDHVAAAAGVYSAFSSRAKFTTARGVITDADSATADLLFRIEGLCVVTVDGDLELWFANEAGAGTVTAKAGSSLVLIRTGD